MKHDANGNAILTPPPDSGDIPLPNGHHLYWKMTEQGREYISDEIGGGVQVWHTALVDHSTLLAAITQELTFQRLEFEIRERDHKQITVNVDADFDGIMNDLDTIAANTHGSDSLPQSFIDAFAERITRG